MLSFFHAAAHAPCCREHRVRSRCCKPFVVVLSGEMYQMSSGEMELEVEDETGGCMYRSAWPGLSSISISNHSDMAELMPFSLHRAKLPL